MRYLLLSVLLLSGCGFHLSIGGGTTQQVRSKFICEDASVQLLNMSGQFKKQAEFATTDHERQMLLRIANGFMDDYRELSSKEACWVRP